MMTIRSACVVSLALLIGFGAVAQENAGSEEEPVRGERRGGMGPRSEADGHEAEELMEAVMTARLAKTLGLNDEQTVLMVRKFSEYKESLGRMRKERTQLLRDVRAALRDGSDEASIEPLVEELVEKDIEIAKHRLGAFQVARKGLTPKQQARLYVFLTEFDADMRHLIQRVRSKRGQWSGRPGDWSGYGPGMGGGRGRGGMGRPDEPPQSRRSGHPGSPPPPRPEDRQPPEQN